MKKGSRKGELSRRGKGRTKGLSRNVKKVYMGRKKKNPQKGP